MAQGHSKVVQILDVSDADAILAAAGSAKRITLLEAWLDKNPDAKATFWAVMEQGYRDGDLKCARILKAFLRRFPDCPQIAPQTGKRIVDAKFAANT